MSWNESHSDHYAQSGADRRGYRQQGRRSDGYQRHDAGYNRGSARYGRGGSYGRHSEGDRLGSTDQEAARASRIKTALLRLGEKDGFHAPSELYSIAQDLVDKASEYGSQRTVIASTFRIMVTEQPQKHPLTAALLATLVLAAPSPKASLEGPAEALSLGSAILSDLLQAFRSYLDARLWRNVRLTLRFFCSLIPFEIISATSIFKLLNAFSAVLEEPAVTISRADMAAICVLEPICFFGDGLLRSSLSARQQLDSLVDCVEKYAASRKTADDFLRPWKHSSSNNTNLNTESFGDLVMAVVKHKQANYPIITFLPSPRDLVPPAISMGSAADLASSAVDIPDTLIPPDEGEEQKSLGRDLALAKLNEAQGPEPVGATLKARAKVATAGEEQTKRAGTGPKGRAVYGRWMPDSTPQPGSASSVVLRSILNDLIDLYEPNRQEAAQTLVSLAKWLHRGTFGGKLDSSIGLTGDGPLNWAGTDPTLGNSSGSWILDDLLLESILSNAFLLPDAPYHELYYATLMREVVTLQPQTAAPAIGKTVRRLYSAFASAAVDVEVIKRLSDLFSAHLSNFGFGWAWKEWVADVSLPHDHPKRAFAHRLVDLCVRLAYYDRIKGVLPPELVEGSLPKEEAGPNLVYEASEHVWNSKAKQLLKSFRAKADTEVVLATLESFRKELIDPADVTMTDASGATVATEAQADIVLRDITVQALLSIGSRSFSHFLNIVERYHSLLRQLSNTAEKRVHILGAVHRFWFKSSQWILIVVDKLLQYRIVEPSDVVTFVFDPKASELPDGLNISTSGFRDWSLLVWWELLRLTVEKINGRVSQLQARVESMEAKADAAREQADAEAEGVTHANGDANSGHGRADDGNAVLIFPSSATSVQIKEEPKILDTLQDRRKALEAVKSEQRKVLLAVMLGFGSLLQPSLPLADPTGERQNWQAYWAAGWFKEFLRRFHVQVGQNQETLAASASTLLSDDSIRLWFESACTHANE